MSVKKFIKTVWVDVLAFLVIGIVFVVPFVFILLTASKTRQEAALFRFSMPSEWRLWQNIVDVMTWGNSRMWLALWNSTVLTVGSVTLIVILAALVAYVMQRRADRVANIVSSIMLAGLILPPSVVPTIFLLQWLGVYKTLFGMIMIEVAVTLSFATLIFRAFMASIPKDRQPEEVTLDEAVGLLAEKAAKTGK